MRGTMYARTAGLVLNYFPYHNWFRLDFGLYYNGSHIHAEPIPAPGGGYNLWHVHYTAKTVGNSYGKATVNPVQPYLGIGFGNRMDGGRLTVTGRLGVLFMGKPQIHFVTNSSDKSFRKRLKRKQMEYERFIGFVHWFPVIGVGLAYRF